MGHMKVGRGLLLKMHMFVYTYTSLSLPLYMHFLRIHTYDICIDTFMCVYICTYYVHTSAVREASAIKKSPGNSQDH